MPYGRLDERDECCHLPEMPILIIGHFSFLPQNVVCLFSPLSCLYVPDEGKVWLFLRCGAFCSVRDGSMGWEAKVKPLMTCRNVFKWRAQCEDIGSSRHCLQGAECRCAGCCSAAPGILPVYPKRRAASEDDRRHQIAQQRDDAPAGDGAGPGIDVDDGGELHRR